MSEAPQPGYLDFRMSLMSKVREMTISIFSTMTEAEERIVTSYLMMKTMCSDMLMLTRRMQLAFKGSLLVNEAWLSG